MVKELHVSFNGVSTGRHTNNTDMKFHNISGINMRHTKITTAVMNQYLAFHSVNNFLKYWSYDTYINVGILNAANDETVDLVSD